MQELLLQGLALRLPLNNITIQKRQKCRNCCSTMPSARLPFSGSKVFVCSPSRCIFVLVLSTFFFSILQVFFSFCCHPFLSSFYSFKPYFLLFYFFFQSLSPYFPLFSLYQLFFSSFMFFRIFFTFFSFFNL